MLNKKIIFLSIMFVLIASFGVVSAADTTNNDTITDTTQQTEETYTNLLTTNDDNTTQTSQQVQSRNLNKNINNPETEKYAATSEEADQVTNDTILKIDPIGYDDIKYHDSILLTGRLTDKQYNGVQGKIHLNFNNAHATVVSEENGDFHYFYYVSKMGSFNITADYSGNGIYSASNDSVVIDVNKQNSRVVLDDIAPVRSGDGALISGRLIDSNENGFYGTVKLLINQGRATVKTDNQGHFTYNCTIGKVGINNVTAWYLESDKYTASDNTTTTFVINKKKLYTRIVFDEIKPAEFGENITISGKLLDENDNPVVGTVKLWIKNGRATVKTDANGVFSYVYTPKRVESLVIKASYLGTNRYDNVTNVTTTVDVEKITRNISLLTPNGEEIDLNKSFNITGQLTDKYGNGIANATVYVSVKTFFTQGFHLNTDIDGFFSKLNYTVTMYSEEDPIEYITINVVASTDKNYKFAHLITIFRVK